MTVRIQRASCSPRAGLVRIRSSAARRRSTATAGAQREGHREQAPKPISELELLTSVHVCVCVCLRVCLCVFVVGCLMRLDVSMTSISILMGWRPNYQRAKPGSVSDTGGHPRQPNDKHKLQTHGFAPALGGH